MDQRIIDHATIQHAIIAHFRTRMRERRVTMTSIAHALGCSTTYISGIFAGREKVTNLSRYEEIARAIGISGTELDEIIRNAKAEEIRHTHGTEDMLADALRASGIIDDNAVVDIMRFIDYRRQAQGAPVKEDKK